MVSEYISHKYAVSQFLDGISLQRGWEYLGDVLWSLGLF